MLAPLPSNRPLRIVFAGTPDVAVGPLRALHDAGFEIACVLTGVDKRRGRGSEKTPSPVKSVAQNLGITVVHDVRDLLVHAGPTTLGVVVAYGSLIPHDVLTAIPMVNVHYSLLPRWRGAAPVERAILAGDRATGVCIMRVVDDLDAGEVYARREVKIGDEETADGLRSRLDAVARELIVQTLQAGDWSGTAQVGEPVYARKIGAQDRRIRAEDAWQESRRVRIGGAFVTVAGRRLTIRHAWPAEGVAAAGSFVQQEGRVVLGCARGVLVCDQVQPEGRSAMSANDWWRGIRDGVTLVVDDD
jgi:methionyl-tRNA formyltransferase